jgi:NRPS condensation-like uncharacterized protein
MRSPFSSVDEVFVHTEKAQQPHSIQFEVQAPGALDAGALRQSIIAAAQSHPIARARKVAHKRQDKIFEWEICEQLGCDPLLVVEAENNDDLSRVRDQFYSQAISLHDSPPFRFWLVRYPDGDYLMLNVNHAAADGIACLRLMQSVLRHYAGQEDPKSPVDALQVRDLNVLLAPTDKAARRKRLKNFLSELTLQSGKFDHIAPLRECDHSGYCSHAVVMDEDAFAALKPKQYGEATMNDLFVAALHKTIAEWNNDYGEGSERIRIMIPVNLRPREWWYDVFSNFVLAFATETTAEDWDDPAQLMKTVAERTGLAKEHGFAEGMLEALAFNTKLPIWAKQAFLTSGQAPQMASAILSNVGRITEPFTFNDDDEASEVWFSPPAPMPDGMGIGTAAYNGRLYIIFRHARELMDSEAGAEFSQRYLKALDWLSS